MKVKYTAWTPAELALLRKVRDVPKPPAWLDIQRDHFPGRSVESCKLACSKHHPDIVGRARPGRPAGSVGRVGCRPPKDDELTGNRFVDMIEDGTDQLGAAVARLLDRYARQGESA